MNRLIKETITRLVSGSSFTKSQKSVLRETVRRTESGRYQFENISGLPTARGSGFKTEESLFRSLRTRGSVSDIEKRLSFSQERLGKKALEKEALAKQVPIKQREEGIFKSDQLRAERTEIETFLGSEQQRRKGAYGDLPTRTERDEGRKQFQQLVKKKEKRLTKIEKEIESIDPRIAENTIAMKQAQKAQGGLPRISEIGDVRSPEWEGRSGQSLLRRAIDSGVAEKRSFDATSDLSNRAPGSIQYKPKGPKSDPSVISSEDLAVKVKAAELESGVAATRNKEFYEHAERMGFQREKVDKFLGSMGYTSDEAYTVMTHVPRKEKGVGGRRGLDITSPEHLVFRHEDPMRAGKIITKTEGEVQKHTWREDWMRFESPKSLDKRLASHEKELAKQQALEQKSLISEQNFEARINATAKEEVHVQGKKKEPSLPKGTGEKPRPSAESSASFFADPSFRQDEILDRAIMGATAGGAVGGAMAMAQGNLPFGFGEEGSTRNFIMGVGFGALGGGFAGAATRPLMRKTFEQGGVGSGLINAGSVFAKSNPESFFADTARNLGGMKKYFIGESSGAAEAASLLTRADRNLMYTGIGLTSGVASSLSMSDNKSRGLNSNRGNRF